MLIYFVSVQYTRESEITCWLQYDTIFPPYLRHSFTRFSLCRHFFFADNGRTAQQSARIRVRGIRWWRDLRGTSVIGRTNQYLLHNWTSGDKDFFISNNRICTQLPLQVIRNVTNSTKALYSHHSQCIHPANHPPTHTYIRKKIYYTKYNNQFSSQQ